MVTIAPTCSDLRRRYISILKHGGDGYGAQLVCDTEKAGEGHLALAFAVGRAYQNHIPLSKDILESSIYYLSPDEDEDEVNACKKMLEELESSGAS